MSITLNQLVEECTAMVQGGIYSSETKLSTQLMINLINEARGTVIREMRLLNFPDVLYQQILPTYSNRVQGNDCYVEFEIPPVLAFSLGDGFRYVGNINQMDNFVRFGNGGASKSVYSKHPITRLGPQNGTMWDWKVDETGYGKMQIYNNEDIEQILVQAIFADPTQVTTYRPDSDFYPISMEMIQPMKDVMNRLLMQQSTMPADLLDSGSDSYAQGQQPTNNRRR